jgi:peptide/nickel transport system permease protein
LFRKEWRGILLTFLTRRIALLFGMMLVGSFLIFSLVYLAPGDPLAALTGNKFVSEERVAQLTAMYHLDQPFLSRFGLWVLDVFRGDLGDSIVFQSSVNSLLAKALPITISLVILSELFIVIFGFAAAVISARFRGAPDAVISIASSLAVSIPVFVVAVVLAIVFGRILGWFPTIGPGEDGLDRLYHLILPAIAMSIGGSALIARIGRSAFIEELDSPHVTTEVARGINAARVFRRHVVRNGLPPVVAVVAIQIPGLIAGAVVAEQVFNLGGVGTLLLAGINARDFALVQAIGLIILATTVTFGIAADIVYGLLDPAAKVGRQ